MVNQQTNAQSINVEDGDIVAVCASAFIKELKTGAWKKQENELVGGKYMVEVYWFPWLHEPDRLDRWEKVIDTQVEADRLYDSLTSIAIVKKLLVKDS